jgi:hypothetical protein
MAYNPTDHFISSKPIAPSHAVIDSRSYYKDLTTSPPSYREYASTAEVLAYLSHTTPSVQAEIRSGHFSIYVKNGSFVEEWWFKDGVADVDLVQKVSGVSSVNGATGAVTLTVANSGLALTWVGTDLRIPTASATVNGLLSSGDYISFASKESALTFNQGLTRTINTVSNNLITGLAGGQTVIGGTASGENLTLQSTSNATKGKIFFGANSAYDGANIRLGINTTSPSQALHVIGDILIGNYTGSTNLLRFANVNNIGNSAYIGGESGSIFTIDPGSVTTFKIQIPTGSDTNPLNFRGASANHLSLFRTGKINYTPTYVTTASSDMAYSFGGNITARATASDVAYGTVFQHTLVASANTQFLGGTIIRHSFTTGAFTGLTTTQFQILSSGGSNILRADNNTDIFLGSGSKYDGVNSKLYIGSTGPTTAYEFSAQKSINGTVGLSLRNTDTVGTTAVTEVSLSANTTAQTLFLQYRNPGATNPAFTHDGLPTTNFGVVGISSSATAMLIYHSAAGQAVYIGGPSRRRITVSDDNLILGHSDSGQKLAFFGGTPVIKQTGGSLTAGASYTANEQDMLQKLWNMAKNYNLIT